MVWRIPLLMCACGVLSARAQDYLLNSDVTPIHYDLMFVYDIDPETQFSYFGVVDILIKATKPTFNITLHAQEFNISDKEIKLFGPGNPTVGTINQDNKYNILNLGLDKELSPNENYTLTIPFSGNLKPGLEGAYISSYVDKATKNKEYLVTTQFESISARRAFPCFDEPAYKATFTINIGHHRDFTAVSNMPLESTSSENPMESYWPWELIGKKIMKDKASFKWEQFAVSVPMSTYLVAWVVSKFSHVQSPEGLSKTKFRIWARSDAIDQTEYASIIGPKVLSHFEEFFNVSFPLPKQDMVAIPDFSAGAMENWGLITYRETALLYDREHSSFLNKERVAEVIAHELAHQWFGNLVTMKWWSDLWLNEGFATFMASVGVRAAEPTWHIEQTSEPSDLLAVMGLDALASSHPVSVPLDDPKRISEIFDEISYRKGSALIRMMNMFLGEDVFRKALNRYLLKYSYSNAEQDDLWRSLTEMSVQHDVLPRDVTVKQIMDTWTKQTGYPLLTVDRDYSDRSLTIKQKRYLSLGSRVPTSVSWWVPLAALCEGERAPARVQWLADNEGTLHQHRFEHGADSKQWVLFNYNMIAPYRVNYDKRNWLLLSAALNSENYKSIPTLGRVQLLSDAFELAWSNLLDYEVAMQLVSYLQRENEYLPLSTGLSALSKISNVLLRSPDYGALQKYIRKLITPAYERAGGLSLMNIINPDDMISVKMQTLTSAWACRMKVPGCEENAILMFQMWMDSSTPDEDNPIPLDLRRTVYCSGISRGGVLQWRFLLERRRNTNVAAARDAMLAALACSSDVWILAQYLEWAITENSEVRRQDAGRVIVSVASTPVGFYVAKDFIYDRIEEIYQVFKNQGNRLGMICKTLVQQFTTQRELDEFLVWREKNAKYLEGAKFGVEQAIEKARVNINWVTKNKKAVVELMRQYSKH